MVDVPGAWYTRDCELEGFEICSCVRSVPSGLRAVGAGDGAFLFVRVC